MQQLVKCADTKDSLVRLVCYDNVVKSLGKVTIKPDSSSVPIEQSPVKIESVVKNKKEVTSVEDSFGREHIKKKGADKALEQVVFTVKSLTVDGFKKKKIKFSNGQIWKQSDSVNLKLSAGDRVELSKGMLGVVYLKKLDRNKKIKVKRLK